MSTDSDGHPSGSLDGVYSAPAASYTSGAAAPHAWNPTDIPISRVSRHEDGFLSRDPLGVRRDRVSGYVLAVVTAVMIAEPGTTGGPPLVWMIWAACSVAIIAVAIYKVVINQWRAARRGWVITGGFIYGKEAEESTQYPTWRDPSGEWTLAEVDPTWRVWTALRWTLALTSCGIAYKALEPLWAQDSAVLAQPWATLWALTTPAFLYAYRHIPTGSWWVSGRWSCRTCGVSNNQYRACRTCRRVGHMVRPDVRYDALRRNWRYL